VIIDLDRFLAEERPTWSELEAMLDRLENDPAAGLNLRQARRLHYLYQRTSADLARIITFASEPRTRLYLELLVARAYGEIHETRQQSGGFALFRWFTTVFPQTFRRHINAFWLSVAITLAGCAFGTVAVSIDPEARVALFPFPALLKDPAERVAREESGLNDRLTGAKATFSTTLMTHNIKVAILTLSLGISAGIGTILVIFYNGVILGAVACDYFLAGQTKFLLGWLLPHGVIEIPAILIAGQAGFLLGNAVIGGMNRQQPVAQSPRLPVRVRLRLVIPDVVTLMLGVGLLLIWAGLVEAFLSQYHEPVIPYALKIGFGLAELGVLTAFLARSGAETSGPRAATRTGGFQPRFIS
jgi:uncharacterized membrane protein SpoIIM required for sporulation